MGFEVDVCHKYRNCQACVTSGDPACGWCAAEEKCSAYNGCRHSYEKIGQWIQGSKLQCITEKVISESNLAVDNLHPVSFVSLKNQFTEYALG